MPTDKLHSNGKMRTAIKAYGSGGDAIAEVYKALKARTFYPEGHPLRGDIIRRAYELLLASMGGKNLSLQITRNGLVPAEDAPPIENTNAAKSLAKELFTREIQMLAFMPGLSSKEFENFLSILTVDPQKIIEEGGVEKVLTERGIQNIAINQIDISAVFTKKSAQESETAELSQELRELQEGTFQFDFVALDETEDMEIEQILDAMKQEGDDGRYARLAAMLPGKARTLIGHGKFDELTPVVLFLVNQCADAAKSRQQQACAHAVFEDITAGEFTQHLLSQLEDRHCNCREIAYLILNRLGEKAVEPAISRLNKADNIHARKALATALVRIGRPAVPSLVARLKDSRWFVVRGMLTILGEIRCKECIKDLRPTTLHSDGRVRKEAIRSITKIGGPDVPDILIHMIADEDPSVTRLAIFSLGILKSEKAVEPLMEIVRRRDFFLKTLSLKKEALQAIGLIGAKKVLPQLMKLAGKRRLFAARSWEELKVSAIEAIGRTGDESSCDFLTRLSARGGAVGKASDLALQSIRQRDRSIPDR